MNVGRVIAIVPAYNESGAIGAVVDAVHALGSSYDVVVIDDASTDDTGAVAATHGAHVLRLPVNLGIGGAVQTGFRAALDGGYDLAVRLDGDGQHDPVELPSMLAPLVRGEADIVIGSRFVGGESDYRPAFARRIGITWFARLVSAVTRTHVTDTTSGFQALNRRAIALFAQDYPADYPEVEATVLVLRHRLRLVEVPVRMREREHGASSITFVRSIYYMLKVTLALLVSLARKPAPTQEATDP